MKADELVAELRRQFEDQVSHFMASDQGQKLIGWYEVRSSQERVALRVLAGFLGALLVYALVLQPMIGFGSSAQHRLAEERELLAWLKSHESVAQQVAGGGGKRDQSVSSLVNATAQQNNLALRRYEPVDENTVKVWLEGASFDSVVKWLHTLGNEHGIHALEIDVERDAQPGLVSVRLTLAG